jgi:uncharacterized protein (TIRG00374 family)
MAGYPRPGGQGIGSQLNPAGAEPPARHATIKRLLQWVLSLAVVLAIFLGALPRIADYADVWATIRDMSGFEVAALLLIGFGNLASYWLVLTAVLPGLTIPQAGTANQASTAVANAIPAGGALGVGLTYAMYSSWGFSGGDVTRSVIVSGIWNNFVKLGLPPLALALLAFTEDVGSALVIAAVVGVVFLVGMITGFALVLRSKRLDRVVGDWLGRLASWVRGRFGRAPVTTWGAAAVSFRITTNDLLAAGWKRLTVTTVVSHLSLYLVLLAALRSVGVSEAEVSWIRVLAAFAFVRLISALPITPGGLGVVELGYTAALAIGLDDPTKAKIVAAVLVFRFITYFLPIPLGAASYLYWRSNRSWRTSAAGDATAGE